MRRVRVRIVRTLCGKLNVDIEAPVQECDQTHEQLIAVLTLLGAAPVEISESPRTIAQPMEQTDPPETIKLGE